MIPLLSRIVPNYVIIASQDRTPKDPTAADIPFKDNREHIVDPDLLKFAANSYTDITI